MQYCRPQRDTSLYGSRSRGVGAAWARPRLSDDEVRALDDAMEEAVADLARDLPVDGIVAATLSLLRDKLWSVDHR